MAKKKLGEKKKSNLFYASKDKYDRAAKLGGKVKENYEKLGGKFNEGYGYKPVE